MNRSRRVWGASGVGSLIRRELTNDTREHVENILEETRVLTHEDIKRGKADPFFSALAEVLGSFHVNRDMREKSRPGAVKANLKAAIKAVEALLEKLNALDSNSRMLVDEALTALASNSQVPTDEVGRPRPLSDHFGVIYATLTGALHRANQYSGGGNLPEDHKIFLAVDVADALQTYFGEEPTTAKKGPFAQILPVVFAEALGHEVGDYHHLVAIAVKHRHEIKVKAPKGLVEYVPPRLLKS